MRLKDGMWARRLLPLALLAAAGAAWAAPAASVGGIGISVDGAATPGEVSSAIKILLGLTVLSLAPAILMSMTSFIRIVVVLSMLRHALGMQETPPNTVIVSLALFLTFFTMTPALQEVNSKAFQPYMAGKLASDTAAQAAIAPLREFMVRQTREPDLALMVELAKAEQPQSMADISMVQLIPAFMLSELRAAFQIGFVIFLPFLLVDLIVSSALMALGMMMVPPASISLPLKILLFVLMDGWNLIVRSLLGTFV
ncbi:flagellar type III secretion system pore protein FliP [Massilia sp. BJB1822]|uniref:flagellar type III secretion system pore protein FliP n=1 Tax=Massilia sp. BJB1822 TaxID=2744470 RepID=UPI0015933998|nr:flagellar type III secretion system pore protein FliP [Massilia sp. BJB1822]NVE01851.1 flagellar type III secretion system pore protein FliP [Massilia sp. BJB1822]